jgi:hypothetical protein
MKIHAHILAWNEEKILPYTLDYYSTICEKIFIYDNMSNDSSYKIYKKYPKVKVVKWSSNEKFNDLDNIIIKNNAYKNSRKDKVDYVIVCDCDEFLYHPNLVEKLKEYKQKGIDMPMVKGYEMISETFPEYNGELIMKKVIEGCDNDFLNKNIIFNPTKNVQFGIGAHSNHSPDSIKTEQIELMLLHYKFLSKQYVINRYDILEKRLSDFNKINGFGHHYSKQNANMQFDKYFKERKKVI